MSRQGRYQVISADSHLEISTDRWTNRVAEKYRDRAPRRITLEDGGDGWVVENRPLWRVGLDLCGKSYEENEITGVTYVGEAGAGSPAQRVAEQDRDGVDAEILFPGAGGMNFWRGIANDHAYKAVIHAYNEFLVEEYVVDHPDRLVAMGAIPETGIDDALDELRYCARGGLKGVCLNAYPAGRTQPTQDDDAFWREAMDLNMAITVHVAMRFMGGARGGPALAYEKVPSFDLNIEKLDPVKRLATWAQGGGYNAVQLLFAGTFERIPEFRIYFAENNLGWIPHFLEQLDMIYQRNIHWAHRHFGLRKLDRSPSEEIKEHVWWGFLNNPFGVEVRHRIGLDRVMWASDFPHSDSDWPYSSKVIESIFADVPEDEKQKMVCGNAVEYFHLDG
jgi:predicted TIM-barrel fold metal-dependent hydrolase